MVKTRFPQAPPQIAALPLDKRGFPTPWFVPWIDGEPDFVGVRPERITEARTRRLCWTCGQPLGGVFAFVIGPMCAVNRVTAEPPNHLACARFAVTACPFLTKPLAKRGESPNVPPAGAQPVAGIMIERNPGVSLIWQTGSYRYMREPGPKDRPVGLFFIGAPSRLEWYAHGRRATRAEVIESIETGLPKLVEIARVEGPEALRELKQNIARAVKFLPAEEETTDAAVQG